MIKHAEHDAQDERLMPVVAEDGMVDERETVFQCWAMLADRSPARTAEIVAKEFAIHVSADLVRKWASRHKWALRARGLYEETAPTYFERVRSGLVGGAPSAQRYLVDVLEGRAEPDRVKVMAAFGVLDRVGFLPYTRREAESGHTPIARTSGGDDWADLSESELQAIVRGRVLELSSSDRR